MRLSQEQADAIFGKLKVKPKPAGTAQMAAWFAGAKESKYGNKKVVYRGETFDSQDELARYMELLLLEKAGEIKDLERQKVFILAPAVRIKGKMRPALRYKADFAYVDVKTGKPVVEDKKGAVTDSYRIKRHLMATVHGVEILET
jgi:hypothetical protein